MRQSLLRLIAIGVFASAAAPVAAQDQLAQIAVPPRIGAAAAVQGTVQLAALPGVRAVGTDIGSGEPIYLGDQVTTGPGGRLQVLLLDETLFTIGPNATLVIDESVYDPATSRGKVAASVVKGAFRFITGKVAKLNPSDMEVKLPVGSIGVRGTSVAGVTDGTSATVVLLGPGPDTDTGERIGRIVVSGTDGGAPVEISRTGFATEITAPNVPPRPPVRLDPARLASLTAPLAGSPQPPPPGEPTGTQAGSPPPSGDAPPPPPPGETTADGPPPPDGAPPGAGPIGSGARIAADTGSGLAGGLAGIGSIGALQPALNNANMITMQQAEAPPQFEGSTTFEQLRSINQGVATFAPQTVPLLGSGVMGSYTISYSYDFSSRTANGQVTINAGSGFTMTGTGMFPLIANPFDTGTGPVVIQENNINVPGVIGGTADVMYKFRNANGAIFSALDHSVTYNQGQTASGSGTSMRQ